MMLGKLSSGHSTINAGIGVNEFFAYSDPLLLV